MSSNRVKSDAFLYDCPDNYVFLDAIKFFFWSVEVITFLSGKFFETYAVSGKL